MSIGMVACLYHAVEKDATCSRYHIGRGSLPTRVGVRSVVAARKICTVILLGVVTIAIVVPVRDVAMGQGGTGSQSPTYTVTDLHPSGFANSQALGIADGQQVGSGVAPGVSHALLWRGSAGSVVDLHPSGFLGSQAFGASGGQQVGGARTTDQFGFFRNHAVVWSGSAGSAVDLNPDFRRGISDAEARGTNGRDQVGAGSGGLTGGFDHALLWHGSSDSVVDLHPRFLLPGPSGVGASIAYAISGGQQVGAGGGPGTSGRFHALLWTGSADSAVDLHPSGFDESKAFATSGGQQVGSGVPTNQFFRHALLWRGSAGSVVDLTPSGSAAEALGTNGTQQVGWGLIGGRTHAVAWSGSANSMVDLHRFLPQRFTASRATAIDSRGNIAGWASDGTNTHAFLWTPSAVAVIILPGLPGSWTPRIRDAFASGKLTNIPGIVGDFATMRATHLTPAQMKEDAVYDDLTSTLKSKGIDVFVMPWDWPNGGYQKAAADLEQFIRDHNFDKVDVIAHSAGGLVAQQYIQNRLGASADPHVRNLILLGTPNQGTLTAHCGYYLEFIPCAADNAQARLLAGFFQLLVNTAAVPLPVVQGIAALHDLMPTFPYLRLDRSLFAPFNNMYLQGLNQQTLSEINQFKTAGIGLYTVRGTEVPTPGIFVVRLNRNRLTRILKPWSVINVISGPTFLGDGSSLAASATIPGFNDVPVPNATHVGGLLNCIKEAYPRLRDTGTLACGPRVRRANTYIYIQTGSPVSILLADPRGRLTGTDFATGSDVAGIPTSTLFQSAHPGIFVDEAIQGKYTLDVVGTGNGGEFELSIAFPNAFPTGLDTTGERFSMTIRPGQRLRFTFDALAFQGVTNLFAAFQARLEINSASRAFEMNSTFTLGSGGTISPATQPMTIQVGDGFLATIPAGSFRSVESGRRFVFEGTVNGVALEANLTSTGGNTYSLKIEGAGARNLPGASPVEVRLGIGNNGGSVSVNAQLER